MSDFDTLCREARTDPRAALALREAFLRRGCVMAVMLPGLRHRLEGSALVGPIALAALVDAAREVGLDAHRHGDIVWAAGQASSVTGLLDLLAVEIPGRLHPAAAVGFGEVIVGPKADLRRGRERPRAHPVRARGGGALHACCVHAGGTGWCRALRRAEGDRRGGGHARRGLARLPLVHSGASHQPWRASAAACFSRACSIRFFGSMAWRMRSARTAL